MRPIDLDQLLINYGEIINVLEYDSMRSAGKAKLNADKLYYLYALKERYTKIQNSNNSPKAKESK